MSCLSLGDILVNNSNLSGTHIMDDCTAFLQGAFVSPKIMLVLIAAIMSSGEYKRNGKEKKEKRKKRKKCLPQMWGKKA